MDKLNSASAPQNGGHTNLPPPLTPPDCDLRSLPYFMLPADRRDSDLFLQRSPEEFRFTISLRAASWRQIPAGSLPDDPRALATLSGAGENLRVWKKHATAVLQGWIKCSDGRLYHPMVAQIVLDAWASYQKQHTRRLKERAKKHNQRHPDSQKPYPVSNNPIQQGHIHIVPSEILPMSPETTSDVPGDIPGTSLPLNISKEKYKQNNSNIVDKNKLMDLLQRRGIIVSIDDPRLMRWSKVRATTAELDHAIGAAYARRQHDDSSQPINVGLIDSVLNSIVAARRSHQQATSDKKWWDSASGITAQGSRLGLRQQADEPFPKFKARVLHASGDGPWAWKPRDTSTTRGGALPLSSLRYAAVASSTPTGHPSGVPPRPLGAAPPPASVSQRNG